MRFNTCFFQIYQSYDEGINDDYFMIIKINCNLLMKSSSKEVLSEVGRPGQFEGRCAHYSVSLRMMSNGSLLIEVEDSLSLERWWRLIDESLLKAQEDPFYQSVFADPAFIFDYVSENFSAVSFTADVLSFAYSYGTSAKSRTKVMAVPLAKQERELELAHLRIDKMNQEIVEMLFLRDAKVKLLEQRIAKMQDLLLNLPLRLSIVQRKQEERSAIQDLEVRQLANRISKEEETSRKIQQSFTNYQINNKELFEECKHIKQKLEKEENRCNKLQELLKKEEERLLMFQLEQKQVNSSTAKLMQAVSEKQQYCERFIDFRLIGHHLANTHSQYYAITNSTANSAKLVRIGGGNNWYNFVNKTEVFPNQHKKYSVRIIKTVDNHLFIGFCTEKGFGSMNNYVNSQAVFYCCHKNRHMYVGGVKKQLSGTADVDGELVECDIDLLEGKINWWKSGKLLTECLVPASMKGRPVYFSIILYHEGDIVEVIYV